MNVESWQQLCPFPRVRGSATAAREVLLGFSLFGARTDAQGFCHGLNHYR
jgi:hypothetical protein